MGEREGEGVGGEEVGGGGSGVRGNTAGSEVGCSVGVCSLDSPSQRRAGKQDDPPGAGWMVRGD